MKNIIILITIVLILFVTIGMTLTQPWRCYWRIYYNPSENAQYGISTDKCILQYSKGSMPGVAHEYVDCNQTVNMCGKEINIPALKGGVLWMS
jgi:hypothetical protein